MKLGTIREFRTAKAAPSQAIVEVGGYGGPNRAEAAYGGSCALINIRVPDGGT